MIKSYRDKPTERFAGGERVKAFSGFARQAEVRLDRLDAAETLDDLAALPGNRQSAGGTARRPDWTTHHQDKRSMAHLFRVASGSY